MAFVFSVVFAFRFLNPAQADIPRPCPVESAMRFRKVSKKFRKEVQQELQQEAQQDEGFHAR
jgi:hypothetical protein